MVKRRRADSIAAMSAPRIFVFVSLVVGSCATHRPAEPETAPADMPALTPAELNEALGGTVDFHRHVRPILKAKCMTCHTGGAAPAGFQMASHAQLMAAGAAGPRIVPGNPEKSRLFLNVAGTHANLQAMPPVGNRPTPREVAVLKRWIEQGAPWPTP